jgi:hypothetical protein
MATTTNYGWTTPDDTALVKDGAAAIRTLGTSVDTTTKALNPSTTLGDIEYRSSTANTNTRLGIGSSGQGLQVVAGVPSWAASSTSTLTTTGDLLYASAANTLARRGIGTTGQILTVSGGLPTWATSTAAGANWTLLNSGGTALTGAQTVTVSGISGVDKVMILMQQASSASSGAELRVRLNTDTGSNYNSYGAYWTNASAASVLSLGQSGGADSALILAVMSGNIASTCSGGVTITGCNSSGVKQYTYAGTGAQANTTYGATAYWGQGFYNSSSTISSISITTSSGNLDNGTVFVYTSA